jgi:hypothetical protein
MESVHPSSHIAIILLYRLKLDASQSMIEEIKDLQACFLPVQWRKEQDFMEKRLCHDKNCHRPD